MLHKISAFCDKIDSVKKMSDDLRVLKYNAPKTKERDFKIQNLIETIQADCLLLANDKGTYDKAEVVSLIILVLFTTQCSTNKNEKKFNQSI